MRIKFDPYYKGGEYAHRATLVLEKKHPGISFWETGEEKDIPDDLTFRENDRSASWQVRVTDDLLSNSFFKIVENGRTYNPNFECSICGAETYQEAIMHPYAGTFGQPLEIKGKRACLNCFKQNTKLTPSGYSEV